MNKIEQQLEKFQKIDMIDVFKRAVVKKKESLIGHIKMQQLLGEASDGSILGILKWRSYADEKQILGTLADYGQYDLNLYGDFQQGIVIDFDLEGNIVVDSFDNKTSYLEYLVEDQHGKDGGQLIFGLNKENLSEFREQIFPELMIDIRQQLGY